MSSAVAEVLTEHGIATTGVVVGDIAGPGTSYVFVEIHRDSDNKQRPSNKKLSEVHEVLRLKGHQVEFVLVDAVSRDLEAGLRATLLRSHGTDVRNVFLSVVGKRATVWIEPKKQFADLSVDDITKTIRVLLDAASVTLESVESTVGANLPTNTICLQLLRQIAPATRGQLKELLVNRKLNVPSDDWLKRRLDSLWKAGFLVWNKGETYALSRSGLNALGSSKKRSSPDIKRVLAIAAGRR